MITETLKDKLSDIGKSMNAKSMLKAFADTVKPVPKVMTMPDAAGFTGRDKPLVEDDKVGEVDTGMYSNIANNVRSVVGKKDTAPDIATKILNFLQYSYDQKTLRYELGDTIASIHHEQEKQRMEKLLETLGSDKKLKAKHPNIKKLVKDTPKQSLVSKFTDLLTKNAPTIEKIGKEVLVVGGIAVAGTIGGSLVAHIAEGESGGDYNANNKGTSRDGKSIIKGDKENLTDMSIEDIQKRQNLPRFDEKKLFAVGKYQFDTDTTADLVERMKLDPKQKFDPETQDKMFQELIAWRAPSVAKYNKSDGKDDKLRLAAVHELSLIWASIGDPENGGNSHYGKGNKASKSVAQISADLEAGRAEYQEKAKTALSSPVPSLPLTTGDNLDKSSQQLKDSKTPSNAPIIINAQQTTIMPSNDKSGFTFTGPRLNSKPDLLEEILNGIRY